MAYQVLLREPGLTKMGISVIKVGVANASVAQETIALSVVHVD